MASATRGLCRTSGARTARRRCCRRREPWRTCRPFSAPWRGSWGRRCRGRWRSSASARARRCSAHCSARARRRPSGAGARAFTLWTRASRCPAFSRWALGSSRPCGPRRRRALPSGFMARHGSWRMPSAPLSPRRWRRSLSDARRPACTSRDGDTQKGCRPLSTCTLTPSGASSRTLRTRRGATRTAASSRHGQRPRHRRALSRRYEPCSLTRGRCSGAV
mmetsp:Transcript_75024/g.232042  ORF Transcript_75024/g.232042 Transcript_75024/m.232042 type:complete len:220 (+) Transcript_75024:230-889(+)